MTPSDAARESGPLFRVFYGSLQTVEGYMRNRARPQVQGALLRPELRDQCVQLLFARALCWVSSLIRLNSPQDFQAVAAGARSLLEVAVDVILVLHDGPTGEKVREMDDWAMSAKFQMSTQALAHYEKASAPIPHEHSPMAAFRDAKGAEVQTLRSKHWRGKHPRRWTNQDLLADCRDADKLEPDLIVGELEMSFEEFYETQLRRMNWLIHGAGLAAVKGVSSETLTLMCALGYKWGADLAMIVTMATLRAIGMTVASDCIEQEWKSVRSSRLKALKQLERTIAGQGLE